MAPVIRSRVRTSIGAATVPGGSLAYINQAGASGRAAMQMGQAVTKIGTQIGKLDDLLNEKISDKETKYLNNQAQINYLNHTTGVRDAYSEGVEAGEIPPGTLHEHMLDADTKWVNNNPLDEKIDYTEFNLFRATYLEQNTQEWGASDRSEQVAALQAKEAAQFTTTLRLINSANNVSDIDTLVGVVGRWTPDEFSTPKEFNDTKSNLIQQAYKRKASIRALGGGNTADAYYNGIRYLGVQPDGTFNEPHLNKNDRTALIQQFNVQALAIEAGEKREKNIALTSERVRITKLYDSGKLTIEDLEGSSLPIKEREAFIGRLTKSEKAAWEGGFSTIQNKIFAKTVGSQNDIIRDLPAAKERITALAIEAGVPGEKITALLQLADSTNRNSVEFNLYKNATDQAEQVFRERLQEGVTPEVTDLMSLFAQRQSTSQQLKIWNGKFSSLLQDELKEGVGEGLTWKQMLNPDSDTYIVDNVVDSISAEKDEAQQAEVKRDIEPPKESTGASGWLSEEFPSIGENTYEIYGQRWVADGESFSEVKAKVGAEIAEELTGSQWSQIERMPKDHPLYEHFPNGEETMEEWDARINIMSRMQ